uniref:Uncharacterized protein n=1 Tax=Myoviridae sp. ctrMq22 TaxID=2825181 RepID=A0A8S5NUV3_9CAUD|nr:MAG TPA: hypothetical protein [Myoviridae sp. ctrMq22]
MTNKKWRKCEGPGQLRIVRGFKADTAISLLYQDLKPAAVIEAAH